MPANFNIRRPGSRDFASALECLVNYRLHPLQGLDRLDPDFPADAVLTVRNKPCVVDFSQRTWVAVRDGVVLGFCCWDWLDHPARIAKTVLICARPDARALGVGDALQVARQDDMRSAGAIEIHTWSDDPRVVSWYCRRHGYERLGVEPIHHTLHLFVCGSKTAWGIHRGHVGQGELTHLRLALL